MKPPSKFHDYSLVLARVQVEMIAHLLRPEEQAECLKAFYEAALAAFMKYEADTAGTFRGVRPSRN